RLVTRLRQAVAGGLIGRLRGAGRDGLRVRRIAVALRQRALEDPLVALVVALGERADPLGQRLAETVLALRHFLRRRGAAVLGAVHAGTLEHGQGLGRGDERIAGRAGRGAVALRALVLRGGIGASLDDRGRRLLLGSLARGRIGLAQAGRARRRRRK